MESLTGSVERITYYNPENGYSVIRLLPEKPLSSQLTQLGLVTVTGNLPELSPGEHLELSGEWIEHPRHGRQFSVRSCEQRLPATLTGIRRYLSSGLIKGIGPRLADRIVNQFGEYTLEIIESQPERLLEVPDIGEKRFSLIASAWEEQRQVKEVMLFLHSYGVSTNLAVKIYKQYGVQALDIVRADPYQMARDIYGVGFKTVDKIAQSLGLPADHPSRIQSAVIYCLNKSTEDGNVFLPQEELSRSAEDLLQIQYELISQSYEQLLKEGSIIGEWFPASGTASSAGSKQDPASRAIEQSDGMRAIYLTPYYHSEKKVAERLSSFAASFPTRLSDIPPAFLEIDPALSPEQRTAVKTALGSPVSVLTGGPGTGKTTTVKALINILVSENKSFRLASPTGRAAKRLAQATDHPASTLHRLLGYSPGEGFKFNDQNPLNIDMLVVDEVSMMDLLLTHNMLKALRPGTHILLVGDADQLPSVGAGDILRDIISSGIAPVNQLKVIFRQAAGSQIVSNAHRINQGQIPYFAGSKSDSSQPIDSDFFLFPANDAEQAADWICDIVTRRIPETFGFQAGQDIQVLSPMYRGPCGVNTLNERLQSIINPPRKKLSEKTLFGINFRVGDKLMQVKNNYDKSVYNGDIGMLKSIDEIQHTLIVEFEGRFVEYDWVECDQLVLAYVISVHKSQGSEFPAVVLPVLTQHYLMLQRNLLYTAVTRAKKLCVLVGNKRAIAIAVKNDKVARRYSGLELRLKGLLSA